jgi:prepilin-type N-terminal cleavage/methylation domain-containing protein
MPTLLPRNEGHAMRRGFTLTEALMAILILGVGLLSLMALYPLAVLHINEALRNNRVAQAVQNARATCEMFRSQIQVPTTASSFYWYTNSPGFVPTRYVDSSGTMWDLGQPQSGLGPAYILDVEGPFDKLTGPSYPSPVLTGKRAGTVDPPRYAWTIVVRPVLDIDPATKLPFVRDDLFSATVVVFEDYDDGNQDDKPTGPYQGVFTSGSTTVTDTNIPKVGLYLDLQYGLVHRVISINPTNGSNGSAELELPFQPPTPSLSPYTATLVHLGPRAVEAIHLGNVYR